MSKGHPLFDDWERVKKLLDRKRQSDTREHLDVVYGAFHALLERKDLGDLEKDTLAEIGVAAAGLGEDLLKLHLQEPDRLFVERSIVLLERTADLIPDSHPAKFGSMYLLSGALALRFREQGDWSDLRASVRWSERATATAPDRPSKARALMQMGGLLGEEYERSGNLKLLEGSVDRLIEALQSSDPGQQERAVIAAALGASLVELTLRTPVATMTGDRWTKAFYAVPFRSLDQQALKAQWHEAFGQRAQMDHPPKRTPSFIEMNRQRHRAQSPLNESPELRAAAAGNARVQEVRTYAELRKAIDGLRARFPGALFVFRGQTDFHGGRLSPSMARKTAQDGTEAHLLWVAAVSENLKYGEPDPAVQVARDIRNALGLSSPSQSDEEFWGSIGPSGPAGQAILQHYGARTQFIDVSTSLEVALWFAHFRFRIRRDLVDREALAASGAGMWGKDDPVPEYDIAWYEPSWAGSDEAWGYLFVIAPRLPMSGDGLLHGEFIDLSPCPSPRMKAQHAGLVYFDLERKPEGAGTVATFKLKLPLDGAPVEVLSPSVERLFPPPDTDPLYGRILWCTPFWAQADRPEVQVRRLRIPEYHSAPAARPSAKDWGDWSSFRNRDKYTKPGLVFPLLAKQRDGTGIVQGKTFRLSEAVPLIPSFPSMMIPAAIPEPGSRLNVNGRSQVFLEYDPLSSSLSPRAGSHHFTQQINRRLAQVWSSMVPLPGVRGAWVIQTGEVYWCRVFTQQEDGPLLGTPGHSFGFDQEFGWVAREGTATETVSSAVEMRAERAAFYHVLGLAEQVAGGALRLDKLSGSSYFRIGILS